MARLIYGMIMSLDGYTEDEFFGIVRRGAAMIMSKSLGVEPFPSYNREPAFSWDAYFDVPDPDAFAAEFAGRGVFARKPPHAPLARVAIR